MSVKPSHIVMGVVGGVIYTAVCAGATAEFDADMKKYKETHEIESALDKVVYFGYGAYRYGITCSKALLSTAALCLMIEGTVSPALPKK